MAGHPIDHQTYWLLALKLGLDTQPKIAVAAGVDSKTVWNALHGRPLQRDIRLKLAKAVGLEDDRDILASVGFRHNTTSHVTGDGEEARTTVLDSAVIQRRKLQDVKLVLASVKLSRSLVTGKKLPSFAECMSESKAYTPIDDRHKDHPFLRDTKFNHFVQPALLVTLDLKNAPNVLGYCRTPRPQVPSQVHTVGTSILFGCSSWAHLDRHKQNKSVLDAWLDEVEMPETAERSLLEGERPVVLQLATGKIDLLSHQSRIVPFGIITRDERGESFSRVYTQFVFHVVLSVTTKDVDRFVNLIRARGVQLARVPENLNPERLFVGDKGRPNAMDIVAWNALHSKDRALRFGATKFWRGFASV